MRTQTFSADSQAMHAVAPSSQNNWWIPTGKALIGLLLLLATLPGITQSGPSTFRIADGKFYYKNEAINVYSGEMHYARIPREYWQHRLKMVKAMGLNAVATYVFWNYHNPAPGVWDFETGNKDLAAFLKLAQQEGLHVILRPGPYACAEWEFGGYPWWLQQNPNLTLRTLNKPFLDSCRQYLSNLYEEVKDYQVGKGGPVVMVQAENEFGSYVSQRKDISLETHKAYNKAITDILKEVGFEGPFFTSDGTWLFEGGSIAGYLPTGNGENNIPNLKKVVNQYHGGQGPYMVAEFYPGWLDHWAEPFQKVSAEKVVAQTKKYLDSGIHFNFYMVHGGTNFGFTSGANYNKEHPIQPDITSYDYDAPISEAGWATPKYNAIRALMQQYVKTKIPDVPAAIPVITIPEVKFSQSQSLFEWMKMVPAVNSDTPMTFESLGQGHGYVMYRRHFNQPIAGKMVVEGLRDFATVYVNGQKVGELNRYYRKFEMDIDVPFNGTLEILVENMGRINYGADIVNNRKGIISPVLINGTEITGNWEMVRLPMDQVPMVRGSAPVAKGLPVLQYGNFTLEKTGDVFLNMEPFGKGIVFVNGINIGRYWHVGPQHTLYVPGCWLKKGRNDVVVFEQRNDNPQSTLTSVMQPLLDKLIPEE